MVFQRISILGASPVYPKFFSVFMTLSNLDEIYSKEYGRGSFVYLGLQCYKYDIFEIVEHNDGSGIPLVASQFYLMS